MTAYYNEFDPKAAAWLRELIKQGHIADGEVDERDLWDVAPADLRNFTQVHLCAGIGVWSYSLRRAGWADDRPAWTASFPCQPFSAAGKGLGFADERHLWPAGEHLIRECRPRILFGEQVASKDAEPWLDAVQADLEALGYAFGACAFPSAGVGAPHIRDRTYWLADATSGGLGEFGSAPLAGRVRHADGSVEPGGMADTISQRRCLGQSGGEDAAHASVASEAGGLALADGGLGYTNSERARRHSGASSGAEARGSSGRQVDGHFGDRADMAGGPSDPGPTNGLWRDADWLLCRDGKWRPVEPGTFPLAHGAPARVGRLRGYGNAINAEAAVAWIEAYLDATSGEARA